VQQAAVENSLQARAGAYEASRTSVPAVASCSSRRAARARGRSPLTNALSATNASRRATVTAARVALNASLHSLTSGRRLRPRYGSGARRKGRHPAGSGAGWTPFDSRSGHFWFSLRRAWKRLSGIPDDPTVRIFRKDLVHVLAGLPSMVVDGAAHEHVAKRLVVPADLHHHIVFSAGRALNS
jgi:hypothetical protein